MPLLLRWLCVLLFFSCAPCSVAATFVLTPPPPLETDGGEVLFLLFALDSSAAAEVVLEPRFPVGVRLLSEQRRTVAAGSTLLPLSVLVPASLPAGRYALCIDIGMAQSPPACTPLRVRPRSDLLVGVPSEVFGDRLEVALDNLGNAPRTLALRGEGEVRVVPQRVSLAPGEARTLTLEITGTGALRLFVGETLYLVTVKGLDGAPPPLVLDVRAGMAVDAYANPETGQGTGLLNRASLGALLGETLHPWLTAEGPLSDYAQVRLRVSDEPTVALSLPQAALELGRLSAPYAGFGVRARYGTPWGAEAGIGVDAGHTVVGAGLLYTFTPEAELPTTQPNTPWALETGDRARLRLLYDLDDEAVWLAGEAERSWGAWRTAATVARGELSAELAHTAGPSFGVRYGYGGSLQVYAALAGEGGYEEVSYRSGTEPSVGVRFSTSTASLGATVVLSPTPRLDWQLGFGERLGPGRYGAFLGVQQDAPTLGGSYALPLPGVLGLNAGVAGQVSLLPAGSLLPGGDPNPSRTQDRTRFDAQYSGTLAYERAPWGVDLRVGSLAQDTHEQEGIGEEAPEAYPLTPAGFSAEAQLRFEDERYAFSLGAALGNELRVTLGGELRLQVPLDETAVETFGGRRWARLSGRVALAGAGAMGEGLEGLIIDAGGRRVKTGANGRYTLWLPPGQHALKVLPEGLPAQAIAPPQETLELATGERRTLDLTLQPAGALRLACQGVPDGMRLGLTLFGASASGLGGFVGCAQTLGGLPAGRYRLEPYGLGDAQAARYPQEVQLTARRTREVRLTLQPRALPETTRPTLTLRAEALRVAAPGEVVTLRAESNAPLVYAVLPDGTEAPLGRGEGESFSAPLQLPFDAAALYTVRLVARAGGGEVLERQTLFRLEPSRPLFETRLEPAQAEVGEEVTVTVEARFNPHTARLVGPGLELTLNPEGNRYTGRFRVPQGWRGQEVTLTLTLTGERVLEESYRVRVR